MKLASLSFKLMRGRLVACKSNLVSTIEGDIDCPKSFCLHYWFMNPYLNVNEVSHQVPQVSFKRFDKNVYCQGGRNFCDSVLTEIVVGIEALKQASISLLVESKVLLIKIIDCFTFLNTGSSYLLIPQTSSQWMI